MSRRVVSALLLFAGACAAQADVLVGDYRAPSPGAVLRFGPEQTGNRAPLATFSTTGGDVELQTPLHLTYDPIVDVVFVSDYYGQAIRVYAADASGNVAPLRTLTSPRLGQPRQVAIDHAHGEMLVVTQNCCVSTFALDASGDVEFPLRNILWGGFPGSTSRLNNPVHLYYLAASDEVVVSDAQYANGTSSGVLLFFARTANAFATPTRAIEGAATQLGEYVAGLAYVPQHGELIALTGTAGTYRIVTFAQTASGNAAPLRVIEGSNLGIENAGAMTYDASTDRLYVLSGAYNSPNPAVLAFARTATGNVAPVRRIAGSRTTLTAPSGIVAAPAADWIFDDGFDEAD
ncbi:MAG TPA: hypothetical protein VJ724_07940 [Tahibacter sp.]|nr:hypothetical protein [Tahibacter sp.]